ncbi:MAG: acetyl/propionyl-CoA carboxylase subunit alpha, partial [Catenulispora sp.]|nr:acetyl/propionyl-CoA carboxylase subunit alpha [Catenulispora sp.]
AARRATVIAHGATRAEAIRKLADALARARIHGLTTNRDLLLQILKNRDFVAGDTHTGFLDEHDLREPPRDLDGAALAAALAASARDRRDSALPAGWRNVRSQPDRALFEEVEVDYRPLPPGLTVVAATGDRVVLERDGLRVAYDVAAHDGRVYVDSPAGSAVLTPRPRLPEPVAQVAPGSLLAPMPGSVLRVDVEVGDTVAAGQVVLVLEAMKMEHQIAAPGDGVVSELRAEKGLQVEAGAVLAIITQEGDG